MKYSLIDSASGTKSLVYNDGREIRLHSKHDPVREAERSVDAFSPGRSSIIMVSGLALAYHVACLKKKFPERTILVIERDREVVDLCLQTNGDLVAGCHLVTGPGDLPGFFETFTITAFRGISHYIHRPSYGIDPDFYRDLGGNIRNYINSKVSDLMTRYEFEELWLENMFANVNHCLKAMPVGALFGRFRGIPGLIVSAGPSLRRNLDLIGTMKTKALVVAVDTALKPLLARGIEPHIVITLDAQKHSLKHFSGTGLDSAYLLADMVSYPKILRDFPGKTIASGTARYWSGADGKSMREVTPGMEWFERQGCIIGDIQSGGSVATSAFDLLLNAGCDPIILAGQDLAYTGREIHCTGTHHNETWLPMTGRTLSLDAINQNVIRKRKIRRVTAWGGSGVVVADFVFDLYRQWFEDGISRMNRTVYNATEGGAHMAGTKEEYLSKLAVKLPDLAESPHLILDKCRQVQDMRSRDLMLRALEALEDQITGIQAQEPVPLEELSELLDGPLGELLKPFMRKIEALILRQDPPSERVQELLNGAVKQGAARILAFCKKARESLGVNISPVHS